MPVLHSSHFLTPDPLPAFRPPPLPNTPMGATVISHTKVGILLRAPGQQHTLHKSDLEREAVTMPGHSLIYATPGMFGHLDGSSGEGGSGSAGVMIPVFCRLVGAGRWAKKHLPPSVCTIMSNH